MHQNIPGSEQAQHVTREVEKQETSLLPEEKQRAIEKGLQALCEGESFFYTIQNEAQTLDGYERACALSGLARSLGRAGKFAEAQKIAQELGEFDRTIVLIELVPIMKEAGATESEVDAALKNARLATEKLQDSYRDDALKELAVSFAKAGKFDEAEKIAQQIKMDKDVRKDLLSEINAHAGQFNVAETIALSIHGDSLRYNRLFELAMTLAQAGEFSRAERIAENLNEYDRVFVLQENAVTLSQHGAPPAVEEAFIRAQSATENLEGTLRSAGSTKFVSALARANRIDQAKKIMRQFPLSEHYRNEAWQELAKALVRAGKFSEARDSIAEVRRDTASRLNAFGEFAVECTRITKSPLPVNEATEQDIVQFIASFGLSDENIKTLIAHFPAYRQMIFASVPEERVNTALKNVHSLVNFFHLPNVTIRNVVTRLYVELTENIDLPIIQIKAPEEWQKLFDRSFDSLDIIAYSAFVGQNMLMNTGGNVELYKELQRVLRDELDMDKPANSIAQHTIGGIIKVSINGTSGTSALGDNCKNWGADEEQWRQLWQFMLDYLPEKAPELGAMLSDHVRPLLQEFRRIVHELEEKYGEITQNDICLSAETEQAINLVDGSNLQESDVERRLPVVRTDDVSKFEQLLEIMEEVNFMLAAYDCMPAGEAYDSIHITSGVTIEEADLLLERENIYRYFHNFALALAPFFNTAGRALDLASRISDARIFTCARPRSVPIIGPFDLLAQMRTLSTICGDFEVAGYISRIAEYFGRAVHNPKDNWQYVNEDTKMINAVPFTRHSPASRELVDMILFLRMEGTEGENGKTALSSFEQALNGEAEALNHQEMIDDTVCRTLFSPGRSPHQRARAFMRLARAVPEKIREQMLSRVIDAAIQMQLKGYSLWGKKREDWVAFDQAVDELYAGDFEPPLSEDFVHQYAAMKKRRVVK